MKSTKIEVYLAIPTRSNKPQKASKSDRIASAVYHSLEELCSLSRQIKLPLNEFGDSTLEIRVLQPVSRHKHLFDMFGSTTLENNEILCLSVQVSMLSDSDFAAKFSIEGALHGEEAKIHKFLIRTLFTKRVTDLLVMTNIGRIGSIEVTEAFLVQDGSLLGPGYIPKIAAYDLHDTVELANRIGWPSIATVDLETIWDWSIRHMHLFDGFSDNSMGRAIAAFSRLLEPNVTRPMQLLWALIGIEALYVRGRGSLLKQVRDKTQAFLGSQTAYKKKLNRMYNFRSRFIHGDFDFPDLHLIGEGRQSVAEYDEGLNEAIQLATGILIAPIQQVIKRNWSGIHFSYVAADTN